MNQGQAALTEEQIREHKRVFTEDQYAAQRQAEERSAWAAQVRGATGSRPGKHGHLFWEPQLDPPPLLAQVSVILISPRRAVSVGTVARACSCFEVEDLRIVQPRLNYITRHSKSASKGAQYILHRARSYASVRDALHGCDASVAFTRWVAGRDNYFDLPALTQHPVVQKLVQQPPVAQPTTPPPAYLETPQPQPPPANSDLHASSSGGSSTGASGSSGGVRPVRIALVFGREELGMSDEEVDACDVACSIPIGRLQESLSLSHAVSLALSSLYNARLAHVVQGAGAATTNSGSNSTQLPLIGAVAAASPYLPRAPGALAPGYDASEGSEV